MGGHGGLNILPQKSWNVYNFENREKVRRDEEAAAKEEQLKQEQSRRRDAEFRLEKLRQANRAKRKDPPTLESPEQRPDSVREAVRTDDAPAPNEDNHINLFKGWDVFQMEGEGKERKLKDEARPVEKRRRKKEEENVKVVLPEDEKYRLGYGVAGKGVKKPWYLSTSFVAEDEIRPTPKRSQERNGETTRKKKSLQELREERLKREQQERERTQKLFFSGSDESKGKPDISVRNRAPYYNSAYQNRR